MGENVGPKNWEKPGEVYFFSLNVTRSDLNKKEEFFRVYVVVRERGKVLISGEGCVEEVLYLGTVD